MFLSSSPTLILTCFLLLAYICEPIQAARQRVRPFPQRHNNLLFAAAAAAPVPLAPRPHPQVPNQPGTFSQSEENAGINNNTQAEHSGLICRPWGECASCPPDALDEPFCQPFGNRQLMHCVNATNSSSSSPSHTNPHQDQDQGSSPLDHTSSTHPSAEVLAWESCGRLISQERADFYEFVGANVLFAILAIGLVVVRTRRMKMIQAKQLAARIGVGFGSNRGGGSGVR